MRNCSLANCGILTIILNFKATRRLSYIKINDQELEVSLALVTAYCETQDASQWVRLVKAALLSGTLVETPTLD